MLKKVESHTETKQEMKQDKFSKQGKDASLEAIAILSPQWLSHNRLILRLLSRCLTRLKLSIILPKVFENPITVQLLLKGTEYEPCAKLLLEYLQGRDKSVSFVEDDAHLTDEKLIRLINVFHKNLNVIELLPNWFNVYTVSDHYIMEAFDLLKHIVDQRMHRSAHIELEKEKQMHKFYRENSILRKEIDYYRRKLRTQKQHQRWKRALRSGDTFRMQDELTTKRTHHTRLVNDLISENAKRIKQLNFGHNNKITQLEEEAKNLEEVFLKTKLANAKQLKSVREEKNKLLIQLQNTIEKHDRLLGEKIKENVYLQDEYDRQREEMDIFMADYTILEREYNEILNAEWAEKKRLWEIKANLFFRTRAARIIQRKWRAYVERQKEEERAARISKVEKQKKGKKKAKKSMAAE